MLQVAQRAMLFATIGTLLVGCATSSQTATDALAMLPVGPSHERTDGDNAILAAMNDGIIGQVAGNRLSERDMKRALAAEYRALETAPVGQSITWSGERSGLTGEVSAAQAYQVGSQNCRRYSHTLRSPGGQSVVARGTACRAEDGTWTPLS